MRSHADPEPTLKVMRTLVGGPFAGDQYEFGVNETGPVRLYHEGDVVRYIWDEGARKFVFDRWSEKQGPVLTRWYPNA